LWTGHDSHRGKNWTFEGVDLQPPPHRHGGPPILVGGSGPRALRIAGELGDGWLPTSPTPEAFATGWNEVKGFARSAGRDPAELVPAVYLTINLDPERGPDEVATYAQQYYGMAFEVMQQFQGYHVGSSDGCLEWIKAYVDAGVRHVLLRFATPDPIRQLDAVAERILPELRLVEVDQ
jgi:alkanesulfonate monooxygenase SsuD/methylene tetrahydromethanopterin reductase-like flavin-dependent oxidoreductase (luciferase family)